VDHHVWTMGGLLVTNEHDELGILSIQPCVPTRIVLSILVELRSSITRLVRLRRHDEGLRVLEGKHRVDDFRLQ
jgi:hypothetical protein